MSVGIVAAASISASQDPQRYLLNALLVPALDPDRNPLVWVDPRPVLACDAGSSIRIDGRPLQPGASVPAGAFVVDWRANGCRPFGNAGPRLDGKARLVVRPAAAEWTASVRPDGMTMTWHDGRTLPVATAQVRMPMGPSLPPPRLLARHDSLEIR